MDLLDLYAKITLDIKGYEDGLKTAQDRANSFGKGLKSAFGLAGKAIGVATGAVTGFAGGAIRVGASFDSAMSQVAATMQKSMADLESETGSVELAWGHFEGNLEEFAKELGSKTSFTATQAADALNYMALAGYNTQQSMEMLPNVLSLAAAGGMDLARASDVITDAQTAFGISSERTTQMVNEMAKAASTGNTNVAQLGDAFLTVGALARELNGGFVTLADGTQSEVDGIQELEIAFTAMANAGVKGSEAGTHMRNMIMKLSSPTKEGAEMMEALGVSVFDADGKMRSLSGIFGDLNTKLGALTQEEKIKAVSELFNARDLASAEALLGAIGQDWNKIGESILNAQGSAQLMADTQLDNLSGSITKLKSAWEGVQLVISDALTPTISKFVNFATKSVSDMTDGFKKGGVTGLMDSFASALTEGVAMIANIAPEVVGAGTQLLVSLVTGITNNIPLLASSAVEIGSTIINVLKENAPKLMESAVSMISYLSQSLIENAPAMLKAGADLIREMAEGLRAALPDLLIKAGSLVVDLIQFLTNEAPKFLESGVSFITELANGFMQDNTLVNSVTLVISAIKNTIQKNLPKLLETGLTALMEFSGVLRENVGTLVDSGIEMILSLVDGLMESLPILLETVPTIVTNIAGLINDNAPKLIAGGIELIMKLVSGILDATPTLIAEFPKIIEAIWSVITAMNWMSLGASVITWIQNGIQSLGAAIPNAVHSIGETAANFLRNINWSAVGSTIINFIGNGISALGQTIPSLLSGIGTTAMNLFRSIDWLGLGSTILRTIGSGISSLMSHIPDLLRSIGNLALEAISNIDWWSVGSGIISGIANGLSAGASTIVESAKNAAKSALDAAKNFLGIASPSKVFRDQIGKMIDYGLAGGIDENADEVRDSVDRLSAMTTDGFSAPTLNGGGAGSSTPYSGSGVMTMLGQIIELIRNGAQIYINGEVLAGELVPAIDTGMGQENMFRQRGIK